MTDQERIEQHYRKKAKNAAIKDRIKRVDGYLEHFTARHSTARFREDLWEQIDIDDREDLAAALRGLDREDLIPDDDTCGDSDTEWNEAGVSEYDAWVDYNNQGQFTGDYIPDDPPRDKLAPNGCIIIIVCGLLGYLLTYGGLIALFRAIGL